MTKQEQLAALVTASETLGALVDNFAWSGVLNEEEARSFDTISEKINKVTEAIRHETTPPTYVYAVWEDWHGNIGYHKTFEGAKEQLMEHGAYQDLADNYPPDYDDETCWGWDVLFIERIEVGE